MTTPAEQANVVKATREFLYALTRPGRVKTFKARFTQASALLKHYPPNYVIDEMWAPAIEDYERGLEVARTVEAARQHDELKAICKGER